MSIDTAKGVLGDATVAELEAGLRGTVVRPGDADYDQARTVWNAAHDKHPALIVRCAGTADVMRAVEFARSQDLLVAVRGGAHSIAGFSTCDDGIVIDLSPMKGAMVDPVRRRVIAQTGLTWGDLDHETQAFGLAVTGGLVSSTGIAGFTLGGGVGWLLRRHGLASDNVTAAEVVTADGRVVRADPRENAELFWALRGGGGNFGVVTSLEYQLHPVGPQVLAGLIVYPLEQARQVVTGWRELTGGMPDELTTLVNLTTAPPLPFLPPEVHGTRIVVLAGMYAGDPAAGEAAVGPLRTLGTPLADLMGPMPYIGMQSLLDPLWTAGAHNYFTSAFIEPSDAALDAVLRRHLTTPTPASELHLHHLGGAFARVPADSTAFSQRDPSVLCNVITRSPDATGFDRSVAWARAAREEIARHGRGTMYVNFTGDAAEDKVRAAYPDAVHERLVRVKDTYDPTNLFRLNQNIRPSNAA
ncbi:FAD-binding oxidoreductase [Streptomyces diastatochromogenes]|uniref:FAD-linked oxidase n=1 Tax=Streptomyces diastatochromogenes TaxID=42236 RepID=A0A233S1G9_STRDA|nr:FAD-binding oxidoreductase [Streptomyces diastatochromogenes]MCZ0984898.1 FAD-binding oxidoreductase [Streptomyces diastatochromogenes]OXY89429.1 FAD-linked oxidase [Streptomyces diastatochromogenes]